MTKWWSNRSLKMKNRPAVNILHFLQDILAEYRATNMYTLDIKFPASIFWLYQIQHLYACQYSRFERAAHWLSCWRHFLFSWCTLDAGLGGHGPLGMLTYFSTSRTENENMQMPVIPKCVKWTLCNENSCRLYGCRHAKSFDYSILLFNRVWFPL